ncbi:amidophosphoribosyltransferase [Brettanomyces nanus]|uniref:Amidophosphoribosyltransferase n=1 Tax=Eeniella nana TaxID=13502 RepID=A0A875S0Q4_EENNA|nr:amidophosphoribosyltransferase [Brettanomyces nanus]QPG73449.1 amidophosphoribosyltransferase [Brettanomyces nanus]
MCGIIGLVCSDPEANCASELFDGCLYLQHRGQDAAGIVTCGKGGRFYQCKGNGMARDVFTTQRMKGLVGNMGIAHLRYPTAGSSANSEAQPFYVNAPYGISLGHNGNLTNGEELKDYMDEVVHRHINTDSDSELLLNLFAAELATYDKSRVNNSDIFKALQGVYTMVRGAYACVAMLAGYGVIGFRDPHGIRPLVIGERLRENGSRDYMVASESVVLRAHGFQVYRDIMPGEAVIIPKATMIPEFRQVVPRLSYTPDVFEYVYFARPDSVLDGISVYRSRLEMGTKLAENITDAFRKVGKDINKEVDVVIPVPDTSRHAALQCAVTLNLPYREGFIKNRYVGRTFIMPDQSQRQSSVRRKLNAMASEFYGKSVLLVDDSIVRGTTSKEIVSMARESGARKVYFASCAPVIRYNHIYGIDLADNKQLVGFNRTEDEVSEVIGADKVFYQKIDDLFDCCKRDDKIKDHEMELALTPVTSRDDSVKSYIQSSTPLPDFDGFEAGVFTGKYVTGDESEYLCVAEKSRARNEKLKRAAGTDQNLDVADLKAPSEINIYNSGDY